ncbi:Aldehyde dehydrogenase [Lunatimonas lonarensis]|uniref:Aldehyde dehydrogenase n=1 Tax=Lunatimonas lonarensis TaxID=1232681 RepID=R7ZXC5_9BACT|nr:aldehyde dehydrogenase family protein [Lunatimonas lonarensis]EON78820.1 Aldehyde dehydrogenase [Lunatimonas lonarensis]
MATFDLYLDLKGIFENQKEKAFELRSGDQQDRIEKLRALQSWIRTNSQEIRDATFQDLGKPGPETDLTEISMVLGEISHAIRHLDKWMKPKTAPNPIHFTGTNAYVQPEPKGRSLIISPWNYPFNLTVGPWVSAIAAGCTTIIKPSEFSPATSALIASMASSLFSPAEASVVLGDVQVAKRLLELPFDHIFFTGSPGVGKEVMKAAANNLSSVTLELGGKSPVVVDANSDLDKAALKIAWGKSINCGQTCIAPDYVLVNKSIESAFLEKLAAAFEQLLNPRNKGIRASNSYGRIINMAHWNRLKQLMDNAVTEGAKITYGGEGQETEKYFAPTILSCVDQNMQVMNEELFGPLLPVIGYDDLDEAINVINGKPKPLALYVFSRNRYPVQQLAQKTSSGALVVNDCAAHFGHPNLPFGGVNNSGIGKAHGYHGFIAFSNEKAVFQQSSRIDLIKTLYPPYTLKKQKLIRLFSRFS